MPPDRSRVLQQAQLLASRGQFDAAIAEWKKLAAETPGDGSIHNSIGDLQLRRNAPAEAATAFMQAAAAFRAEGATLKAIAAFKKVLKCDPTKFEVYRHLGDLNVERGLVSSAVQDYLTLGKYYLKERRGKDALEIFKKIVVHDPSNLNAQQRVAELCVQENQQDEATKVYLQLGRERSAQGRYDEAKDAYLAVLRIDPANSEAAQFVESLKKGGSGSVKAAKPGPTAAAPKPSEPVDLLAEAIRRIAEKQYAGAEAILNQMLTREPGNPQVCQLLARLHLQRGDVQVALGEYRFLAGAALRAHDLTLADSLIQEFLSAEPNSVPLLELNGELHEEQGDGNGAAMQYAKAIEILLQRPEPGMETLHEELFEKVRSLSTDETLVNRLLLTMKGSSLEERSSVPQAVVPSDASSNRAESSLADEGRSTVEAEMVQTLPQHHAPKPNERFSLVGAQPDGGNPFGKDTVSLKNSVAPSAGQGGQQTAATVPPEAQPTIHAIPESTPLTRPSQGQAARASRAEQPDSLQNSEGHKADTMERPRLATTKVSGEQPSMEEHVSARQEIPSKAAVQVPAEPPPDFEAHYTLGVAYKNMGLYEEAREAFQVSLHSDSFYLDSALMTAVCLKEAHQIAQAILGLETVLADPRCQGAKGQAIRYELGLLYEAEEQWDKAAQAFQSIPSFHDVSQRLVILKGKQRGGEVGFRYAS